MIQMLELVDKDFRAVVKTVLSELKNVLIMNEEVGNFNRKHKMLKIISDKFNERILFSKNHQGDALA